MYVYRQQNRQKDPFARYISCISYYKLAVPIAAVTVSHHGCHRSEMSVLVHSWATSLQANSLLYGTTDVLVGSEKPFTVSFFANSLSGSVHPCTLPDASFCCAKTSLLIRTPDIRVRSEELFTVSFFENRRHRYKARAKIKRRRTFCTLSIYFCAATP